MIRSSLIATYEECLNFVYERFSDFSTSIHDFRIDSSRRLNEGRHRLTLMKTDMQMTTKTSFRNCGSLFRFWRKASFQKLAIIGLLIATSIYSFGQTPNNCGAYTSTGTQPSSGYSPGPNGTCTANVIGQAQGAGSWTGTSCSGQLITTVSGGAVNCLVVTYTAVNDDDFATININNGGGPFTITGTNVGVNGNVIGPYNCGGPFGDVSIVICSPNPFTTVTLTNTGCNTGWVSNCADQSACTFSNAGADSTVVVCSGVVDLNTMVTGTLGGTWTETTVPVSGQLNSASGIFNAGAAGIGTYTFDYEVMTGCTPDTAEMTVIVTNSISATWTAPVGLCSAAPPVDLSTLVTGTPGGVFTGTGITGNMFDPSVGSQTITYTVGTAPCDDVLALQINVGPPADATWSAPTGLCTGDAPVDLSALITGTTGGTFSGTGITGNMFDPSVGSQTITYTAGTAPCDDALALQINVGPSADATWTAPAGLCIFGTPFDLSTLITGTTGGTFSGTGITGNMFDPTVGTQTITYTVGTAPCDATLALQVNVGTATDATWTAPTGLCTGNAPVDLSALITGTPGGTFTGTGITGTMFDPSVGTQTITYSVGVAPCDATLALQINVGPTGDATWTAPVGLCTGDAPVDVSALITGTPGGTFSGTGVTGNMFDPSVGTQTITYSVGTAPCDDALALQITVGSAADATWSLPSGLCITDAPIDLSTLITGTPGGTFTGTGVAGTLFDPSVGTQTITYTVGTAPCDAILAQQITVDTPLSAGLDSTITICGSNPSTVDLNTLLNGADLGGTWMETSASGQFNAAMGELTLTGLAEGLYTFTYTQNANSNCIIDVATFTINYGVLGNAGLDGQVVICHDNGLIDLFSLISGNPDTGGTWTPQTTAGNGIFDPAVDNSGTYNYTVYSSPFCPQDTSKATLDVINIANIQIVGPSELCIGNGSQVYTANVPNGTWSGQGISNQGTLNPSGLNSGSTTITYTVDSLGCQSTSDFTIALNDIPTIAIFYNGEICEDGEQFIAPIVTNATNYFWSDGHTDLNRIIEGDYSLIDQSILLTLTAENECGNASENVVINVNQCNETVFVPNAFTPDGDEFNQTFKPVLTGIDVHNYQMIIFNRWGELIFETNNPEVGWDGTYGGEIVQDGIYTWSLQYKLPNEDGNTRLVGHVNLIK